MSSDVIKGGLQPVGTTHRDFGIDQTGSSNNIQSTPPPAEAQNTTSTNANNIQQEGVGKCLNCQA